MAHIWEEGQRRIKVCWLTHLGRQSSHGIILFLARLVVRCVSVWIHKDYFFSQYISEATEQKLQMQFCEHRRDLHQARTCIDWSYLQACIYYCVLTKQYKRVSKIMQALICSCCSPWAPRNPAATSLLSLNHKELQQLVLDCVGRVYVKVIAIHSRNSIAVGISNNLRSVWVNILPGHCLTTGNFRSQHHDTMLEEIYCLVWVKQHWEMTRRAAVVHEQSDVENEGKGNVLAE